MIYNFLEQGGWTWMFPILVVSVIGLMFILERAWFWFLLWLRRDRRLHRRLLRGDVPTRGTATRDPRVQVLLHLAQDPDDTGLALERARMLVRDSKAHLRVLAIVAGLGSALGLFGTVVGMSKSFEGVSLSDPTRIVTGLQSALNTTILGLVVYLTCYTMHAFFAQQSVNLGQDLEEDMNHASRSLRTRQKATA